MGFTGNLLINSRTIIDALEKVSSLANKKKSTDSELSIQDLVSILTLLEAISTSNSIMYDGTLPQRELDRLSECERDFEGVLSDQSLLSTAAPCAPKLLSLCNRAILETAPTLKRRIEIFLSDPAEVSKSLPDVRMLQPRKYFRSVGGVRRKPIGFTDTMVKSFSKEFVRRASPSNYQDQCEAVIDANFTGAKCVAGMLSALAYTDGTVATANAKGDIEYCVDQIERCHGNTGILRYLVPLCMNTFRSSYLSLLAGDYGSDEGKGLYFSTAGFSGIMRMRAELFSNRIFSAILEKKIKLQFGEKRLVESMYHGDNFPFFGLLYLLAGKDGEPYSVFEAAIQGRQVDLAEHIEKRARKPFRYNQDEKDIEKSRRHIEEIVLSKISNKAWRRQYIDHPVSLFVDRAVHLGLKWAPLAPAVILLLSDPGRYPNLTEVPWPETGYYEAPSPLSGPMMESFFSAKVTNSESLAYVAFNQQVDRTLRLALANTETQNVITERVESIFNCRLVEKYSRE